MSAQILLISALITFVACGIMFFYFKNRIAKTEQKVDLMFQLIQEHQRGVQIQKQQFVPRNTEVVKEVVDQKSSGLIDISDTEVDDNSENYDSDDSVEVSDDEDDRLQISSGENLASTNKIVSLTLDGAETGNKDISMDEVTELTEHNLDEDLENNTTNNVQEEIDAVSGGNNNDVDGNNNEDENDDNDDNDELDTIELSEAEDDNTESNEEDVQKKVVEVESPATYSKMNMSQLKAVAMSKGLSNYKGLRKQKLVELLSSGQ